MTGGQAQYGALAAKVKALYGKRLRLEDFQHMAAFKSEAEVLEYLRAHPSWSRASGWRWRPPSGTSCGWNT